MFMKMPTPCQKCDETFDLHDGLTSTKWFPNSIICEECGEKERAEVERDEEREELRGQIEDSEFRPPEVTRFQPLRGIARFYYSAAPSGGRRGAGCDDEIAQSPMDIDDFAIRGNVIMVQSAHNNSSDRRAVTRKSLLTK